MAAALTAIPVAQGAAGAATPKPRIDKIKGYNHCIYGPRYEHKVQVYLHIFTATMPRQRACAWRRYRSVTRYNPDGSVKKRTERLKWVRMYFDTPLGNSPSCILNPALAVVSGRVQMEGLHTRAVARNTYQSSYFCVIQATLKTVITIGGLPIGFEFPVSGAWQITRTSLGLPTMHSVLQVQACNWNKTGCSSPQTLDHRYKQPDGLLCVSTPSAPGGWGCAYEPLIGPEGPPPK